MITEQKRFLAVAGLSLAAVVLAVGLFVTPLASLGVFALVFMTAAGLITALALVRPIWVLYAAVALLPVWSSFEIGKINFSPFELMVMFLFFVCLLRWLTSGHIQAALFSMPNPWIWLVVASAFAGALAGAPDTIEAINIMRKSLLLPLAFYIVLVALVKKHETVIRLLWVFVLANSVIAAYSVYVYYQLSRQFRAGYSLTSSVFLGISCTCGIIICYKLRGDTGRWKRRMLELLLLTQFMCLILTFTRVAIICLLAMPVIYWLLFKTKHRRVLAVSACVVVSLLLFGMCFSMDMDFVSIVYGSGSREAERVVNPAQYQDDLFLRFENWSLAFDVFLDSPLFGHGFYPFYKLADTWRTTRLSHPHSIIFNLLVSSGLVGAIAFLLFFGAALRMIWPACFERARESSLQRILFLCLWCMVLDGLMNGIFIWVPIASLFFFFLGLCLSMSVIVAGKPFTKLVENRETHETDTDSDGCPYPAP